MNQIFQRRPSQEPTLFINTSSNMKNSMNLSNLPVTSFGKGEILKPLSTSISYPMRLKSATDESEEDRMNHTTTDDTGREDQDETNQEDEDYDDSGHEEDEDLVASEEIILPDDDDEDEEEDSDDFEEEEESQNEDDESKIFKRQMAYPPMAQYNPPGSQNDLNDPRIPIPSGSLQSKPNTTNNSSTPTTISRRPSNPRERIGVLTPMEEVTEPPSSAGTEASGVHQSRRRKRTRNPALIAFSGDNNSASDNGNGGGVVGGHGGRAKHKKSILKSKSPTGSPERRVKFVGAGSITTSERTTSPAESMTSNTSEYSSMVDSGRKTGTLVNGFENGSNGNSVGDGAIPEETEGDEDEEESTISNNNNDAKHRNKNSTIKGDPAKDNMGLGTLGNLALGTNNGSEETNDELRQPVMETVEKVQTWQLGSDSSNDDPPPSALDSEFASILDDIIAELHSWDRLAGTGAGVTEVNASRQDHLANVSSQLTSYLGQVSAPTVMTNLPQIIPLVTTLLSVTEMNFRAQLTSLNTVNVLINRLKDCKIHSGLKVLPNADLTWLIRTLCDISSESSRSVLKSEGTAALAKLVKAAGPEMICEPILFILMGNDDTIKKSVKRREGSGNIITTGAPGGAPKIKGLALDTLTFALLTFPRDNFDLDVVAKLACHCLLHSKRRVRQAALECLAVVSHAMGSNLALPMFRKFILEEEGHSNPVGVNVPGNVNASNSSISTEVGTGSGSSTYGSSGLELTQENKDLRLLITGPPSRIPVPIRTLQVQTPVEPTAVPSAATIAPGGPSPGSAVRARVSRHVLPSASLEELVEYAVKIPAKCQVLSRQSVKIGSQKGSSSNSNGGSFNGSASGGQSSSGSGSVNGNSSGNERLSSSGESISSISNIDYTLLELEPVLNSHGSGVGQRRRAALAGNAGKNPTAPLDMAPDILWILSGSGPVKKYDPASRFPKERNEAISLNRINSQQWPGTISNSSGTESEFNNSSSGGSQQRIVNSSDFDMRRINRADIQMQESLAKDPVLGRYYYPPPTNHHSSPRGPLNSSDSLSSRLATTSSFGLLPNKYSVLKNSHHSSLLPGAYDHPFGPHGDINGYNSSNGSNWSHGHSDYLTYSSRMSRPMPLQPISSLREKFFDSSKRNGGFDAHNQAFRSESPTTEDEAEEENSESENEKTEPEIETNGNEGQRSNQNVNKNGRKPVNKMQSNGHNTSSMKNENGNHMTKELMTEAKSVLINKANVELTSIQRQGEEFPKGVNRDFQVYHHRIEVEQIGPVAAAALAASMSTKRGDVDSAGSNNTRDSGVSLGSIQGSKSPPSDTTPPPQHRTSGMDGVSRPYGVSASQRSSKSKPAANKTQLNRNWQSTPDVPTASDTDDGEAGLGNSRRNHSGSPTQFDQRLQLQTQQVQAQTSSSEGLMLLHRKPVLARRGQSVGRVPVPEIDDLDNITMPEIRYPVGSNRSHVSNSKKESGGDQFNNQNQGNSHLTADHKPRRGEQANTYRVDGSVSAFSKSAKMRHSVSTGNLGKDEDEDINESLSIKSRSTYLEISDEGSPPTNNNYNNRKGRLAQRNNGPFGDVRASTEDFSLEKKNISQILPRKNTVAAKVNAKIVPTKVYKGSFRDISRKGSNGSSNGEVFPLDLKPVTSAKHALPAALQQLQSSEWETNVDGFRQIVRIIRYHPETIRADLHNVNMAGIRHLANLRSQVCRSAILCFKEMFTQLGKSMEADSEKIAEKLLDKSADTNKFIREDSGKTLDAMIDNLTPTKGLTCLDLFGTRHRNPAVRCMAAKMTTKLVQNLGAERCLTELPERLLPMLCKLLQEGGLETRTTAKTAISILMTHPSFNPQLKRYVPSDILRHAQKSIDSLQK